MTGKVESLKREVERIWNPKAAMLFVGFTCMGAIGLLAHEPGMAIVGMVAAVVVAHATRKADHRWRDTTGGTE